MDINGIWEVLKIWGPVGGLLAILLGGGFYTVFRIFNLLEVLGSKWLENLHIKEMASHELHTNHLAHIHEALGHLDKSNLLIQSLATMIQAENDQTANSFILVTNEHRQQDERQAAFQRDLFSKLGP